MLFFFLETMWAIYVYLAFQKITNKPVNPVSDSVVNLFWIAYP